MVDDEFGRSGGRSEYYHNTLHESLKELIKNETEHKRKQIWVYREGVVDLGGANGASGRG